MEVDEKGINNRGDK